MDNGEETNSNSKNTGGSPNRRLRKKAVIKALEQSLGVVATACHAAGVNRKTFYRWMREDEKFKAAVDQIGNLSLDFSESQLFKVIKGYTMPDSKVFMHEGKPVVVPVTKHVGPDTTAIIFHLKTKGKERGYIERQDIGLTSSVPVAVIREIEVVSNEGTGDTAQ